MKQQLWRSTAEKPFCTNTPWLPEPKCCDWETVLETHASGTSCGAELKKRLYTQSVDTNVYLLFHQQFALFHLLHHLLLSLSLFLQQVVTSKLTHYIFPCLSLLLQQVIVLSIIIKEICTAPIFHVEWKRRALYNITNNTCTTHARARTHTHTHTHTIYGWQRHRRLWKIMTGTKWG